MSKRHFIDNGEFKTPAKTREANARWRQANPEKMQGYQIKWSHANLNKRMWQVAKQRSKRNAVEFSITPDDIVIPETCPILGMPLVCGIGQSGRSGGNPDSPSLDRIDSSKGYEKGNIRVISHLANSMKGAATQDQLIKFANWIIGEYNV